MFTVRKSADGDRYNVFEGDDIVFLGGFGPLSFATESRADSVASALNSEERSSESISSEMKMEIKMEMIMKEMIEMSDMMKMKVLKMKEMMFKVKKPEDFEKSFEEHKTKLKDITGR